VLYAQSVIVKYAQLKKVKADAVVGGMPDKKANCY
jgi:hypothetical protein